ncbi:MAG: AMP-binding protein, partial [Pseudomonadota bacterium]
MKFSSTDDARKFEREMTWDDREKPQTLYQMLREVTDRHPNHDALSFQLTSGPTDAAQTLSWKQFHDQVCQAANLFRSLGIGETDVVALILPNTLETAVAMIGGMIAGIANPINPLLEAEQISAILRETDAKVVVTLRAFPKTDIAEKTAQAVKDAPSVKTVLEIDLNRYLSPPKSWIVPFLRPKVAVEHSAQVMDFNKAMSGHKTELDFPDSVADRVAAYFHTGGTTGMPKVAQHRYSGMVYNGWLGHELLFTEDDNVMCPLPLFHVFAAEVLVNASLASGAHLILPTPAGYRGDGVFDNFWKLVER